MSTMNYENFKPSQLNYKECYITWFEANCHKVQYTHVSNTAYVNVSLKSQRDIEC